MFDSPDPAPPVNSGEPLSTMAARPAAWFSSAEPGSRILEIMCMRNSSEPSETRGRPGPKRPPKPATVCSRSTSLRFCFQSTPNGGLERQ